MGTVGDEIRGYKSDMPEHADTLEAIAAEFDEVYERFADMDTVLDRY